MHGAVVFGIPLNVSNTSYIDTTSLLPLYSVLHLMGTGFVSLN